MRTKKKPRVVSLFGAVPVGLPQADPEMVEVIERLLSLARDGELHGLAYASTDSAGSIHTAWCGKAEESRMVAAVTRLYFRINEAAGQNHK